MAFKNHHSKEKNNANRLSEEAAGLNKQGGNKGGKSTGTPGGRSSK
jgi:hypothetical protein